ncbi:unnamed protein product, partial [Mesorhabditis spiculigera]
MRFLLLVLAAWAGSARCSIEVNADTHLGKRKAEDTIPVVEIRGEGKPMSAAQIRHLEEVSNGGPLDIKIETVWKAAQCDRKAQRKDFITLHFKCFTEEGKKVAQSYGDSPIRIQLGVGMAMRGLDKGISGMCAEELRKITIPYRLSRKGKSRVWKFVPNDEHWLTMQIELLSITPYSHAEQFRFLDMNNDTKITEKDLVDWSEGMKKNFGKTWKNEDVDNVIAAKYYIKYFDINGDGEIDVEEFERVMERDEAAARGLKTNKSKGRRRDPGFAWILDFDNDGIVTYEESDEAATLFEAGPTRLPVFSKEEL